MNSNIKSAGIAHAESAAGLFRVAIVGAASLKGKEVAEALEQRHFPALDIKLLDDDEALGQLEALKDEVTFIQSVRAEQFEHVDFTFFASDEECTRKNWKQVAKSGSAIVDLSYALEDEAGASIRSPWLERQLGQVAAPDLQPGPVVIAHPAAQVLGLIMLRLHSAASVKRAVATVFEPVSERGQRGMDELHEQTVNLLSFQPLPKNIYDVQVAFNMVSRYGEHAPATLSSVERRIAAHYRRILGDRVVRPSLQVLQAPVFHGYVFSMNVQFDKKVELESISNALAGEHLVIVRSPDEAPNNVNSAGQGEILLTLTPDSSDENSAWIWTACDNLRIAAITGVECAEAIASSRPRGQIQ